MKHFLLVLFASICAAQTDGPAQLPIAIPSTIFTSANAPTTVGPTDNLQAAVSAAVPGDTLIVDSNNVWTGPLTLPTFPTCDTAHAVTIEGAAFASGPVFRVHPGMPMPKIVLPAGAWIKGGTCVQFIGFEVTIPQGSGIHYQLIAPGPLAHDLIFDRIYCHGDPQDDVARCFATSNVRNLVIIRPWVADIHCMAVVGACTDSQAISGGASTVGDEGPILIADGYLESAGENIIFGGGSATVVPHDITIVGNEIAKPDSWNPSDVSYTAVDGKDGLPHPYIVKNLLEFKNCNRCLVENNYFHGSWGGFSQLGWAWLITPKNQAGAAGTNLCPICADTNITIRYNRIQKTAAAMQIGFGPSDNGGWPAGANSYSIHDNQFEHMQYKSCHYPCSHYLIQISAGSQNGFVMHDVSIDHNSFYVDGWLPPAPTDGKGHGFLVLTAPVAPNPSPYNMAFTNNVVYAGNTPLYTTGGGAANCANSYVYNNYAGFFTNCWLTSQFTGNVILTQGYTGNPNWPAGNYELPAGANINSVPQ